MLSVNAGHTHWVQFENECFEYGVIRDQGHFQKWWGVTSASLLKKEQLNLTCAFDVVQPNLTRTNCI